MKTPVETEGAAPSEGRPEDERSNDRLTRRLLNTLLVILALASIGLLILLFLLLRPEGQPGAVSGEAGYPIKVVASITGFGEAAEEQIRTPLGVTFDADGNVWISDTGNSRVLEFDSNWTYVRTIGVDEGPGQLATPYGLAVDPDRDRIYVADWANEAVRIYSTSTGSYLGDLPNTKQRRQVFGPGGFSPFDVAVTEGHVVASSNDGLYFFDLRGHVIARWGGASQGGRLGMFNFPDALDVDPQTGNIYVADSLNRRVVALDPDGVWRWVSGRPDVKGKLKGFWQLPRSVGVGPDGSVYVVDTFRAHDIGVGTGYIVVLSPDGRLLSEFGRFGPQEDSFSFPEGFAVGPDGLFAIADREKNRVVIFRLDPIPPPADRERQTYEASFGRPTGVRSTPSPVPSVGGAAPSLAPAGASPAATAPAGTAPASVSPGATGG